MLKWLTPKDRRCGIRYFMRVKFPSLALYPLVGLNSLDKRLISILLILTVYLMPRKRN